MDIPQLTKAEKRIILTLGRHQDGEEPLNMTELCEAVEEPLQALQRGKPETITRGFIEEKREHPATILRLTEKGEELYDALEVYTEALQSCSE